jgi:transposase
VETIVWLDRTGAPWRDLPVHYGPWETVASRFYRWRRRGVWDRVLAALQADADVRGELDWLLHFVDGSVVRAHQHAAGARRQPAKADLQVQDTGAVADPDQPGDREALGRSRGGHSTNLHLRVEGRGKPMVIMATAGQRHEARMLRRLMEAGAVKRAGPGRPRLRPDAVTDDKGYSYPGLRRYLRRRGIRAVIPSKSDQPRFDKAPAGSATRWSPRSTGSRVPPGRDPL